MSEFFSVTVPWNRRLWSLSLVLSIREALEVARAVEEKVVWEQSLDELKVAISLMATKDAGIGQTGNVDALESYLKRSLAPNGHTHRLVSRLVEELDDVYLDRWTEVLSQADKPLFERAARCLASHLLGAGFSPEFLTSWLKDLRHTDSLEPRDISDQAAKLVAASPMRKRRVVVAFTSAPPGTETLPREWINASALSAALQEMNFPTTGIRQNGGFMFRIDCRDEWSAAEQASELLGVIRAREELNGTVPLQPRSEVWIEGARTPRELPSGRGIYLTAIAKAGKTYSIAPGSRVDSALELFSSLEKGAPGTAVATAWAAIELLLVGPGDLDRGLAADRCADIIMCSLPRAELTRLAHAHVDGSGGRGPLAQQISKALLTKAKNRAAARLVEVAIRQNQRLDLSSPEDRAAETRMTDLIVRPGVAFPATLRHIRVALRRVFRLRNMVLHSGQTSSVALRPGLRMAAPLIATALDDIAYRWFVNRVDPLEIGAIATLRIDQAATSSRPLYNMLGG